VAVVIEALIGDAENPQPVSFELRVADAVSFDRARRAVKGAAVELHHEPELRPVDVDQLAGTRASVTHQRFQRNPNVWVTQASSLQQIFVATITLQQMKMKRWKHFLALGAFFVVGVGLSACGSGVPGDSVADMAGNPVSLTAFKHWMFVAAKGQATQSPGAPVIVPTDPPDFKGCIAQVRAQIPTLSKQTDKTLKSDCGQLFTSLSGQVMDFLIRAYWYQADAAKLHMKITDADVQKAFQSAKKQQFPTNAAFQTFLTQSGQTLQDILFRVRVNQIYMKLLAKHQTTVSAATIQAYYKNHTSQFGTPETLDIRIIRTSKPAAAAAAKAALQHGQSWAVVAKKYSIDTQTKSKGGLLTGVSKGQEEQALDTAAFAAPVNKLQGVIHGQFGYYVFEVTKVKKATQQSLAQATPLIKQILNGQSQTAAQKAVDSKAKKDWLSKTTCRSLYAMNDCSGYKAPKTTTATPTPTATAPTPTATTAPTPTTSTPTTTTSK
jgi:foldase protein PrsA